MGTRHERAIASLAVAVCAASSLGCVRGSALGTAANSSPPVGPDRALGTAAPTVLLGAAPDGAWLAICQARQDTNHDGKLEVRFGIHGEVLGDRLVPYLLFGPGPGREITRFLRSDPTGRWLVYVHDGKRWLLDTRAGREIDLDATRPSPGRVSQDSRLAGHEAWTVGLSFDADGTHLLFVAEGPGGRRVAVLRRLADGQETELDAGPGVLWQAAIAKQGPYIVMRVVERDTNGDGTLSLPQVMTRRDTSACSTTFSSATIATYADDDLSWRVARVGDRSSQAVPGFETVFGDAVVRSNEAGALELDEEGTVRELLPAACGGHVVMVNPARDVLVVSCEREDKALYVVRGGRRVATGCVTTQFYPGRPSDWLPLTCPNAAGQTEGGFIAEGDLEIVLLGAAADDGAVLVRSAMAGPDTAWQRRTSSNEPPKVVSPDVLLCSQYWTLDLKSHEPRFPGQLRVTRGTMGGNILAASGVQGLHSDLVVLGPLFWSEAVDPIARCRPFGQNSEEFYERYPAMRPR